MNEILIALLIGIIVCIIDVIPMVIQKLDKFANLSAFTHWVILGLIIPFVDWNLEPWFKGFILGELSAILGIGVAIAGAKFIELDNNNNREWFHTNKKRYEQSVKIPFENFIQNMIFKIQEDDENLITTPKESIFRIYRDIRFSKDKTP